MPINDGAESPLYCVNDKYMEYANGINVSKKNPTSHGEINI